MRISKVALNALAVVLLTAPRVAGQTSRSTVDSLVADVSLDSLITSIRTLTGIDSVHVSDSVLVYRLDPDEHVRNRWYADTTVALDRRVQIGNEVAAWWLSKKLRSFGYDEVSIVGLKDSPWRQNVIAEKTGSTRPDRTYILCAHYDAVPPAPGADDNGSGTAAVLEAARVLAHIDNHFTLKFALWDAEEIGLIGSKDFAQRASEEGAQIGAVVNLDMIAWDGDDDGVLEIHTNAESRLIADEAWSLIGELDLDLQPVIYDPGARNSDHASFWNVDYPAVMLIEEIYGDDFNPHYHSEEDKLEYFNSGYFFEIAKLATGMMARYAETAAGVAIEPEGDVRPNSPQTQAANWPNPFTQSTTFAFSVEGPGPVTITIFDTMGRVVDRLEGFAGHPGIQNMNWIPSAGIRSGIYFYRIGGDMDTTLSGRMTFVR